jgi:hypothetical protein
MNKVLPTALFVGLSLTACGTEQQIADAKKGTSVFATAESVSIDGTPVTLAGVTFAPPANWIDMGPSGMRKANYAFGPVSGTAEAANVAVFYFGPDQGGSVEANLSRWVGQMATPEGGSVQDIAIMDELTVDGMTVSTVEVAGSYNASMGGPMGGHTDAKEGFLLIGAVVQGPEGNVFFKLTGPELSATAMSQGFVAMIKGVKRAAVPSS